MDREMPDEEVAETLRAVQEGLESMKRGEGIPLDIAIAEMRRKYRIPNLDSRESDDDV